MPTCNHTDAVAVTKTGFNILESSSFIVGLKTEHEVSLLFIFFFFFLVNLSLFRV